ncbi:MAG: hypothetical protein QOJ01_2468 [Solirubrobacterales bacterium]|jgi:predicted dithiol-disulfide oxidoreductase (DUF899 family)|nr:hypothetical protein [Solirubrobacterales bacterium]
MAEHKTATREEWQKQRDELLVREKELTRLNEELARARLDLPWVPVEKDYGFDTEAGAKSLAELFDGRSQLVVYNFMFGPEYEAGCPVCSSIADSFNGVLAHLAARDVTMICISRAPLEKLLAYRERMGWSFNWASSHESDFNFDFGRSHTEDEVSAMLADGTPPPIPTIAADCGTDPAGFLQEGPGLTAFALSDGVVHLTYSTTARGLEPLMVYYGVFDRAPRGRHEGDPPELWFRRHDEYPQA